MHLPTLIVGAIFLLIGSGLGGSGLYLLGAGESTRLEADGRTVRGTVLHKAIHASRVDGATARPAYRIDYRFAPPAAGAVTASDDIDPALWKRLGPGDAIEVVYLPAEPQVHRVEGVQRDRTVALVFLLIGLVFAPLGAWLVRGAFARTAQPPAPGAEAPPGFGGRLGVWLARSPVFAFGVGAMVFFLPFAAAGVAWFGAMSTEESLFTASSRTVQGMVLEKAVVEKRVAVANRPSRPSTHYQVAYRFPAESGEEVIGTSEVAPGAWERLKERGPIGVRYVAGSPWLHRLENEAADWTGPAVFASVGGGGMLAGAIAAFLGWPAWASGGAPRRRRDVQVSATSSMPPRESAARAPSRWALVFGGIFFFAGSAAFIEGWGDLLQERRYAAEGLLAEARITGKAIRAAERSGRKHTAYVATYRFTSADGRAAEGEAILEVGAWEAAAAGDRIRVRYLSDAPQTNRAAAEGGILGVILVMAVGLVFVAAGAGIAYAGWWLPRR